MGILTRRGAPDWHPAPLEVREAGRKVVELCEAHGVDPSELALKFSLEHPGVVTTLVGMSNRKQVEDNLRALHFAIDPVLLAEIHEIVKPVHNLTWPSGHDETMAKIIDAHHHLWRYTENDYGWISGEMQMLQRDFLPTDILAAAREAGVGRPAVFAARIS